MDERRFYQRPWFAIFLWLVLGGGFYLWQVRRMGGFLPNLSTVFFDILIFFAGLIIWMAFFAQFVLPVRSFQERQNIFDRLLVYLSGGHGPAIFIRDGKEVKRQDEEKKKGPGVLWLDSASAAVTRNAASYKQTIGPGVHFTEKGEFIAGVVDLHAQNQGIGPREEENPFAAQSDEQSDEEYKQIQKRRLDVSAWTRDGIEVVPNISVTFRIAATPAKEEEQGSRFGFDAESVRRAVTGEGVNPGASDNRKYVAWNQLPAFIAADLWREYLSKFTLAELFEASQTVPTLQPPAPAPKRDETQAQLPAVPPSSGMESFFVGIIHELNSFLGWLGDRCERGLGEQKTVKHVFPAAKPESETKLDAPQPETALQTINRMIKARMTEPKVIFLDDSGKAGDEFIESPEYKLIEQRGLKVLSAGVNSLRFPPNVEDQLVRQWSSTWLESAKSERDRIERLRGFVELSGQTEAVVEYTRSLSSNLLRHRPSTEKDTLKVLMLRSRDELVKNDRMHRRASIERGELEDLIVWAERGGK